MSSKKAPANKSKSPLPKKAKPPTTAELERDLRELLRQIYELEDSLIQSRNNRDYIGAEMKERELANLRVFHKDKEEEIKRFDRERLDEAVAKKMEDKYSKAAGIWDEKMQIFEDHVAELQEDLVAYQELQVQAKLDELELLLPKETQTNQEIASLRRNENLAVKKKEYI